MCYSVTCISINRVENKLKTTKGIELHKSDSTVRTYISHTEGEPETTKPLACCMAADSQLALDS